MECSTYNSFFINRTIKFLLIFIIIFYEKNRRGTGSASQIYMLKSPSPPPPKKKKILFLILVIKTQWIHVCSVTWLLGVIYGPEYLYFFYSNFEQIPSPVGTIFVAESSVYLRNHTSFNPLVLINYLPVKSCTWRLTNNELEHK